MAIIKKQTKTDKDVEKLEPLCFVASRNKRVQALWKTGMNLCDLGIGNNFLDMAPKAQETNKN